MRICLKTTLRSGDSRTIKQHTRMQSIKLSKKVYLSMELTSQSSSKSPKTVEIALLSSFLKPWFCQLCSLRRLNYPRCTLSWIVRQRTRSPSHQRRAWNSTAASEEWPCSLCSVLKLILAQPRRSWNIWDLCAAISLRLPRPSVQLCLHPAKSFALQRTQSSQKVSISSPLRVSSCHQILLK